MVELDDEFGKKGGGLRWMRWRKAVQFDVRCEDKEGRV